MSKMKKDRKSLVLPSCPRLLGLGLGLSMLALVHLFGYCDGNHVTFTTDPWEVFYSENIQSRSVGCTGKCEIYGETVQGRSAGETSFCYSHAKCAPKTWKGVCKSGKFQSPIDLDVKMKKLQKKKSPEKILAFGDVFMEDHSGFYITNNGHSVTVYFNDDFSSESTFKHTDTKLEYSFAQLHFHWATGNSGSEHTLGKKRFPMEMHLVHYKTKYKSLGKAVPKKDDLALAVLGIFFTIGEEENMAMKPIVDAIEEYDLREETGTVLVEEDLNLYNLLPEVKKFFRYRGSLTIPACAEKLNWAVFTQPIEISKEQMEVFRKVESTKEKNGVLKNYRPIQSLNNRKMEYFA